jgi:hypothetical protein
MNNVIHACKTEMNTREENEEKHCVYKPVKRLRSESFYCSAVSYLLLRFMMIVQINLRFECVVSVDVYVIL